MNRRRTALGVLALALPLLGMGALGGGAGGAPARNYSAVFVDRDGTRVEATWVSAGGELTLAGELGRGTVSVPFDDIAKVTFRLAPSRAARDLPKGGAGDDKKALVAAVDLRKGDPVELAIRSSLTFTGQTAVGQYRIRARDLASVEFAGK